MPHDRPLPQRHTKRWLLAILALLLAGAVYLSSHRFAVYDWWRLRGYTPPAAITALSSDDQFTTTAAHIYDVNHPQLLSRTAFAPYCPSGTEQTVVLGCYHGNQDGIDLLQVTAPELHGIEQVTAAHEMLHAAYDRLSSSARQKVGAELQDYYQHGLTDPAIKQTIASYQKTEPHDVVNEMHSVFGTEVANLPAPLETYYKQYFKNRSVITGYYQNYEAAFTSRQNEIKQDDNQLAAWKTQIDSSESTLAAQRASLTAQQNSMIQLRQSNPAAYNAQVDSYNRAVDSYNQEAAALKSLISQYNQLVATRNNIALEEQQLVQDISSGIH